MVEAVERRLIYVVDDDISVRNSLCAFLTAHGFQTAAFSSAEDFLAEGNFEKCLCVFLDLRIGGMGGMEVQKLLTKKQIAIPVIILTAHGDVPLAVEAMKAGAVDFIEKPGSAAQFLEAIKAAANLLADRPQPAVPKAVVAERLARLTSRERVVLDHLVLGMTNKQIADDLGISQRTVEIHRARIREKMEARGLFDLIRLMK
ncbi:FixJ family two-component response regulator [Rhodoligotrophos appendicifer]|uniref:response regulator transcription factor n=1 Tax=Rhodoligotrophos appendicifer TaxID=987056 RepID=UPI0011853499|nr:response regulator [Rhodoligotrophos appendicifer]